MVICISRLNLLDLFLDYYLFNIIDCFKDKNPLNFLGDFYLDDGPRLGFRPPFRYPDFRDLAVVSPANAV